MLRRVYNLLDILRDGEILASLKVSLPLVFIQLVGTLYSLTDTYFVKDLGEEALAALGIAGYLLNLILVFMALFSTPLVIMASQSIGAGDFDKARRIGGEIILKGSLFTLFISLIAFLLSGPLVMMQSGATGLTYEYTLVYFKIRVSGLIVMFITSSLDILIIATGRTMFSLMANATGLLANIVLDPLMIYGLFGFPRLGVAGAAYATITASLLVMPLQLRFLRNMGLIPLFRNEVGLKRILEIGWPAFIERAFFALGNNIYAGVISRLGSTAMAAHNIGLRIESIIYMPGFAFMMTASTLVGQRIGRGDINGGKSIGFKTIMLGTSIMTVIGIVVGFTGYYITMPFAPNEEIRRLASIYLAFAGFSELGLGLSMITSGAIRGAGDTKIPLVINTSSLIVFRVIPSILLANHLGVIGPWLSMFIDVYARGIILITVFQKYFNKLARKVV
ncbi:MAG: MATE family efflux transporter [Desulfurococcaceae archaeon]